ncbi:hypothetical protein FSARC_3999 [Fusarium sarcochroum]|uniref:RRM domain-containing protein n=1 Tax=Fusarium sarcochroum TaxID=1208366 RepID=A0A8H4U2R4_9HYPO|nr:hypothetical protein FSARC_3999 [Fusarium sarcochroum]
MATEQSIVLTLNTKPNMAAVSEETAPISSKAAACLGLFDRCIAMTASVDAQKQSSIEDQIARFSIWTFNMAVFAKSKLSLDHRLRWTPQVRDLVTGLLGVLGDYIQQLLLLLERLEDSEFPVPDRNQFLDEGNFEPVLSTIANELTLLNELSNTIRKASRKAQDEKALREFAMNPEDRETFEAALQKTWTDNLLDRFPNCSSLIILERLAKAMVLRRKKILYRRSRFSGDPLRTIQTTDKPSLRPLPNRQEPEVQQQPRRREAESKLSGEPISSEKKWQEHVTGDLEAYVCLFEKCDESERMWTHGESWLKHMRQHALQWRCPAKSHRGQTFLTQQDFKKHLEQDHKKKYTEAELSLVINRSRQSTGPLFTSCPLCGQEVQQAGGKIEKHIAGHLRSLALKSLPPVYDEEDDEDGENAERSGGVISNRSTIKGILDISSQGTFNTLGYVKYVTDKVDDADLKNALAAFGELTYFDINRQKNCAFVEYKTPEGYQTAVAANPHTVNGEYIVVEARRPKKTHRSKDRRPKANAYQNRNRDQPSHS